MIFSILNIFITLYSVTMLCSTLLRYGIDHIKDIEEEVIEWMEERDYESVLQLQGSMSQMNVSDPSSFERAQYMRALNNYVLNF